MYIDKSVHKGNQCLKLLNVCLNEHQYILTLLLVFKEMSFKFTYNSDYISNINYISGNNINYKKKNLLDNG